MKDAVFYQENVYLAGSIPLGSVSTYRCVIRRLSFVKLKNKRVKVRADLS